MHGGVEQDPPQESSALLGITASDSMLFSLQCMRQIKIFALRVPVILELMSSLNKLHYFKM